MQRSPQCGSWMWLVAALSRGFTSRSGKRPRAPCSSQRWETLGVPVPRIPEESTEERVGGRVQMLNSQEGWQGSMDPKPLGARAPLGAPDRPSGGSEGVGVLPSQVDSCGPSGAGDCREGDREKGPRNKLCLAEEPAPRPAPLSAGRRLKHMPPAATPSPPQGSAVHPGRSPGVAV